MGYCNVYLKDYNWFIRRDGKKFKIYLEDVIEIEFDDRLIMKEVREYVKDGV